MTPKNPAKVETLTPETVPLTRLGRSTLEKPIPEDRKRVHAAVIARARAQQQRERER